MAKTAAADASVPSTANAGPPGLYRASWIDRLMAAVERLRVPYWLTYLGPRVGRDCVHPSATWLWAPETRFILQPEAAVSRSGPGAFWP